MKETSSTFVTGQMKDIFDFNDLVNDIWLAFPKGRARKIADKILENLHTRFCGQEDPNCFLCQHRWLDQMVVLYDNPDLDTLPGMGPDPALTRRGPLPAGYWFNQVINEHMRQDHYRRPLTHTPEDLWKIWAVDMFADDNTDNCMFPVVREMEALMINLSLEQVDAILASGWDAMFLALHDDWIERELSHPGPGEWVEDDWTDQPGWDPEDLQ